MIPVLMESDKLRIKWFPCRYVNNVLQRREARQDLFRGEPVGGTHRKIVVIALPECKLR